jgi:hypothetical protein
MDCGERFVIDAKTAMTLEDLPTSRPLRTRAAASSDHDHESLRWGKPNRGGLHALLTLRMAETIV